MTENEQPRAMSLAEAIAEGRRPVIPTGCVLVNGWIVPRGLEHLAPDRGFTVNAPGRNEAS